MILIRIVAIYRLLTYQKTFRREFVDIFICYLRTELQMLHFMLFTNFHLRQGAESFLRS
jgi:hypothetical protein